MKKILVLVLILLFVMTAFPEKVGIFTGLVHPEALEVAGNIIYVVEKSTVHTYSRSNLKKINSYYSVGHGPGELVWNSGTSNYLVPLQGQMLIGGFHKAMVFKPEGEIIREIKIRPFTNFLYPLQSGYLGLKFEGEPGQKTLMKVWIYDSNLKGIKEIYRQKYSGGRNMINLTFDGVAMAVEDGKLYIEESPVGFRISIYNLEGKKLQTISPPIQRIKFGKSHRDDAIRRLKQNPLVRELGWEQYTRMIRLTQEEYLPPIQDMTVNSGLIFVQTHQRRGSKIEFQILGKSGKMIAQCFLPYIERGYRDLVMGRPARLYKFVGDYYYYVLENNETEDWELHRLRWRDKTEAGIIQD